MKLKNKKTGQIGNFIINKDHFECVDLDYVPEYRNLAELNEEWEDYEEKKQWYWFISDDGEIGESCHYKDLHVDLDKDRKEIGNYFETEEEAEKAAKKLRAWKRLKSCRFKFKGWRTADLGADKYYFVITAESDGAGKGDLDLLFGGEE